MERNKESAVREELEEELMGASISYDELMEQIDEVIGYDHRPEEPVGAAQQPAQEAHAEEIPAAEPAAESMTLEPAAEQPAEEAPSAEQNMTEAPAEELPVGEVPAETAAPDEVPAGEQENMEETAVHTTQETVPTTGKGGKAALWALLIVAVLVVGGYLGLCAYAGSLTTFYPGQAINGIAVGGMTASQAQTALEEGLSACAVTLTDSATGETLSQLPLMELGYDVEDFAGDAQFWLEQQQSEQFVTRGWTYLQFLLGSYPGGSNWPDHDAAELAAAVAALERQLEQAPVHAAYELAEGGIRYTKARDGRSLDTEALAAVLCDVETYHRGYQAEITFESVPADVITAQQLHDTLFGSVKNAAYDTENAAILPEQIGVDFNVAAAQAAINGVEPGETFLLEAVVEYPAVTAAELEQVLFKDVLGEWKTHVSGTAARINNVKLSAATINGHVMNAGDVFSYNDVVGQRTAANGYQAAPAYIRGETVDEIGGGICQTSSTLYYACLLAQVEIVERYPHRYVPAYIPWGMDATVSWGGPDYKFANNSIYPIKIVTEYAKNYLTVKVLGTRTLDTTVKMTNEVVSTTPWTTVYEVDETLAPGTPEVEKTTPYTGYKVRAYRNVYDAAGKLISTTLESNNDYKVRNQVIVRAPEAPAVSVPVVTDPVTGEVEVLPAEGSVLPEEVPVEELGDIVSVE